jgi:hypothetical protein
MAKTKKTKLRPKSKAPRRAPRRAARKTAKRAAAGKGRRTKVSAVKRALGKKARAGSTAKAAKRPAARSKARRPAAKPAAKRAKRLAPALRHIVESDEPRERVGDADDRAFVGTDTAVDEAQELGEEFVRSVTSGEEAESEMEEEEATEEQGGPFVVTSASTEYGFGTDESNPADAEKAPFPHVSPAVSPKSDGEDEDQ